MKIKLYDLDKDFNRLVEEADIYAEKHDGELPPDIEDKLCKVELEREQLALNYGRWIMNNQAYIDMLDNQIKRLKDMQRKPKSDIEFARQCLENVIAVGEKFQDETIQIKWNKGQQVELVDETEIPGEFVSREEIKYDKMAIKRALKAGEAVPGAKLKDTFKLGVK